MCDQPKIHIFLGAPPASSSWARVSGAGTEEQKPPPVTWRHLELTWQDGHLKPLTDHDGNEERWSSEEDGAVQPVLSLESGHHEALSHQSDSSSEGQTRPDGPDPGRHLHCSASVHQYLESCFSAEQQHPPRAEPPRPEPQKTEPLRPEPLQPVLQKPEPRSLLESEPQSLSAFPPLSTRAQYLSTWALSQALFLSGRCSNIQSASTPEKAPPPHTPSKPTQTPPSASSSTPELFSPETSSPGASAELFSQPCPTPRAEEGGVVIEVTKEGVLCSQGAEQQVSKNPQSSPCISPQAKKVCIAEEPRTEASVEPSDSTIAATRPRGHITPLTKCDRQGSRYSVLVAVVHPCYLKEVKVKSGPAAGTAVPLASIVVTDQSGVEMKVVLWRRAAFWVLTVSPGDILLLTGLQVNEDRWRGETILQSTFSSKLLNLGPVTISTSPPVSQLVDARSLNSLYGFLRERRPLLVSLNCRPPQDLNRLPYASLKSLRVNTLVHALLRVTQTLLSTAWRSGAESRSRAAIQTKAVLTVEQPLGQQGALLLWGAAVDWLPLINRDRDTIWDVRFLLVKEGLTSDLLELHSTPWSSLQPLDPSSPRAQDFLRPVQLGDSSIELDVDTLLSQRYSGEVQLRVQVVALKFQHSPLSQNALQTELDSSTSLEGILEVLSSDITYTGCGRCSTELDTDANGIYSPCYPCLPHTAVRRYYRPGVLTVCGRGTRQVCVQVPPVPLQKILEAPPDKLHRSTAPSSAIKHIQVAAEKIQTLLSKKTFIITIRSNFMCDENSIPISQDFTLLDLHPP